MSDAVRVRFVQMNTALDESIYLPYSVALLQAYLHAHAPRPERYAFGIPLVHPLPPAQAVEAFADADIAGFSTYVWNGNRSLATRYFRVSSSQCRLCLRFPKPNTIILSETRPVFRRRPVFHRPKQPNLS